MQMKLATEDPREYVSMLTALGQGLSYKMKNGSILAPNATWRGDSDDTRSASAKVMQNAFMGKMVPNYNSKTGKDVGASRPAQSDLASAIFNQKITMHDVGPGGISKAAAGKLIENSLANGKSVSVSFKGHAVLVTGLDRTVPPPSYIIDSWGQQYRMSQADFDRNLEAVRAEDPPHKIKTSWSLRSGYRYTDLGPDYKTLPGNTHWEVTAKGLTRTIYSMATTKTI